MLLFLNNLVNGEINLAIIDKGKIFQEKFLSRRSDDLLPVLTIFCKKYNKKISATSGLIVVNGPGSFSRIRTAMTFALFFNSLFNVKTVAIKMGKKDNIVSLIEKGTKALQAKTFKPSCGLKPFYGQKPHIT